MRGQGGETPVCVRARALVVKDGTVAVVIAQLIESTISRTVFGLCKVELQGKQ